MIFSSEIFLFFFLPITFAGYYIVNTKLKNVFLLIMSIIFYAWGEPEFVFVLMFSIFVNYIWGLLAAKYRNGIKGKIVIGLMVFFNVSLFFVFKYLDFTIDNINKLAGKDVFALKNISLPIGISFFTFQAMSYVIDVYRENGSVQKNPLNVALYITFFPQLIAGPIVRYETVSEEIKHRKESVEDFNYGVKRFICGLGKKVLLANQFAIVADYVFAHEDYAQLSAVLAWLGSICYTLQIYFDFSGYSDMAIGLGRMFGFHFNENFNYPYVARSITDFWRRWHISLSTWFRDYIYIPLGGSRCSKLRNYRNLFCVWLLTGIWHGASWNFILWGLLYFILLVFEKNTKINEKLMGNDYSFFNVIYRIFTLVCVNFAWVLFRAENLSKAWKYIKSMLCINGNVLNNSLAVFILKDNTMLLVAGFILATPIVRLLNKRINGSNNVVTGVIETLVLIGIFVFSISFLNISSYNPFLYFNF